MTSKIPTPYATVPAGDGEALGAAVVELLEHQGRRPRLLGFGEPTHGEDEFLRLRNGLFAHLVERAGYRSIALESSAWSGRLVDDHVRTGRGDEDEVMARGFSHDFGASPANRELVRWMREVDRGRPEEQRLRFAGFDAATEMVAADSPRESLAVLHAYLREHLADLEPGPSWEEIDELLGDDARWTDPAASMHPARSIGGEPVVRDLRVVTDELRWLLACEAPALIAATSSGPWWDADLAGRTAAGLLAYHAAMARDTPLRWQHLSALRDTIMADNLRALADREADRGPTLVFAHNLHLRTGTASMAWGSTSLRWQPAGAHLALRPGHDYVVIGTTVARAEHLGVGEPDPATLEGALATLPPGNHLFADDQIRAARLGRPTRTTGGPSRLPLDGSALDDLDAVVFLSSVGSS